MKRIVSKILLPVLVLCMVITGSAAEKKKITVEFTVDELAFSINIMNSIVLTGEEVTPFLDIRNMLVTEYKKVSSGKKKEVELEFTIPMAKNFLFFMQRGKLKGAEAAVFSDISSKMVEAIKKATK